MLTRTLLVGVLFALVNPPECQAITYRLSESSLFDSHPFGFSGLITTDGTVGVLSDASFIETWSIIVLTPSTTDGVSSEVLTPANSSVSLFLGDAAGLLVTPTAISMPPAHGVPLATLSFFTSDDDTRLTYTNRFTDGKGVGASVGVFDPSEENSALGVVLSSVPIAIVVPEPSAAVIGISIIGIAFLRSKRSVANRLDNGG